MSQMQHYGPFLATNSLCHAKWFNDFFSFVFIHLQN